MRERIADGYYRLVIPTEPPPDEAEVERLVSKYFGAERTPTGEGGSIKRSSPKLEL